MSTTRTDTRSPVAVLGLGASGEAAARLLARDGREVTVLEARASARARLRADALFRDGIAVRWGEDAALPAGVGEVVVSPGVPASSPWMAAARAAGAQILSEIDLGMGRLGAGIVAVTGSNGKSTLVKWLTEALQRAGRRAAQAGNCGPPVSAVALEMPALDWLVLEVSSFQLETAARLHPAIAILLNLTPNHLDRHGTFEAYAALKARLFDRMRGDDAAIVPADRHADMARRSAGQPRWIAFGGEADAAAWQWRPGTVVHGGQPVLSLRGTRFDNRVLGPSAAAAAAAMSCAGAPLEALEAAARDFVPLPHRMEPIGVRAGVRYVNDSKATSLAALSAGLQQAGRPVRLIAGGLPKDKMFGSLKDMLAIHCRGAYLVGSAAERMAEAWSGTVPCKVCGSLEQAVGRAAAEAKAGETVLLSPGCASFDQFENFEERGNAFREVVLALGGVTGADEGTREPLQGSRDRGRHAASEAKA